MEESERKIRATIAMLIQGFLWQKNRALNFRALLILSQPFLFDSSSFLSLNRFHFLGKVSESERKSGIVQEKKFFSWAMNIMSSKDSEVEKIQETEQKIDPEPMKPEESQEEKRKATCVSARDMILKSLRKTKAFLSDLKMNICEVTRQRFIDDFLGQLQDSFLSNPRPLLLPRWNSDFQVYELVKTNCDKCQTDTEYRLERSYAIIIIANFLRETKYALKHLSFENILKLFKIKLEMPCKKEECGKQSHVLQRVIKKLPSVFIIALEWENNETEKEIIDTISILKTEIDMSEIYNLEDDCTDTKYYFVSMVCSYGVGYSCVACENNKWVRHFGIDQEEVIGEWDLNMRPEILFFENVVKRDLILNKQRDTKSVLELMKLAQIQHLHC